MSVIVMTGLSDLPLLFPLLPTVLPPLPSIAHCTASSSLYGPLYCLPSFYSPQLSFPSPGFWSICPRYHLNNRISVTLFRLSASSCPYQLQLTLMVQPRKAQILIVVCLFKHVYNLSLSNRHSFYLDQSVWSSRIMFTMQVIISTECFR